MKFIKKILSKLKGEQNLQELINRGLKIGKNVTIMSGVIIDPSHCWHIEIGVPAKVICSLDEYLQKKNHIKNTENTFDEEYTMRNPNFSEKHHTELFEKCKKYGEIFIK